MAKNQNNERDNTNEAFFSLKWRPQKGMWDIGGTWTDNEGQKWDLGYSKTAPAGLVDAVTVLVKNLMGALNGKGVRKEDWKGGQDGR